MALAKKEGVFFPSSRERGDDFLKPIISNCSCRLDKLFLLLSVELRGKNLRK